MASQLVNGVVVFPYGSWCKDTLRHGRVQEYLQIKEACTRDNKLWRDPQFPPNLNSIGQLDDVKDKELQRLVWKRPPRICRNAVFVLQPVTFAVVAQGLLGDCYLLAAIADVSRHPAKFDFLAPTDQSFRNEYCGVFRCRFFVFGEWLEVVVDDLLPVLNNGRLLGAQQSEQNEFVVPLIEKCYAKLFGGYHMIDKGGYTAEALVHLTGGVGNFQVLDRRHAKPLFHEVLFRDKENTFHGATILRRGKKTQGIPHRHAHGVLDVAWVLKARTDWVPLIKVFNPWGHSEWQGAWHDRCPNWALVSEETRDELQQRATEEGASWMEFSDFLRTFSLLDSCTWKLPPAKTGNFRVDGIYWEIQVLNGQTKSPRSPYGKQTEMRLPANDCSKRLVTVAISQVRPIDVDTVKFTIRVYAVNGTFKGQSLSGSLLNHSECIESIQSSWPEFTVTFTALAKKEYIILIMADAGRTKFFVRTYAQVAPSRKRQRHVLALEEHISKVQSDNSSEEQLQNFILEHHSGRH